MCLFESDMLTLKLHFLTRRYYPGIKYHVPALTQAADEFGIRDTKQIATLSEQECRRIAAHVLRHLPESACPVRHRDAVA